MVSRRLFFVAAILLFVGLLAGALRSPVVCDLPRDVAVDDHYLAAGQMETQANDLVAAVGFDYRSFDLFALSGLVIASSASVVALLRKGGRRT